MEIFWDYIKNNYPNLLGILIYIGILFPSLIVNCLMLLTIALVLIILPVFLLVAFISPTILDNNRSYNRAVDLIGGLGFWIGVNVNKSHRQILVDLPVILIKRSITKVSKGFNKYYIDIYVHMFTSFIDGMKKSLSNVSKRKNNSKEEELKWWMRILFYPPGLIMMASPFLILFVIMFIFSVPLWLLIILIIEYA